MIKHIFKFNWCSGVDFIKVGRTAQIIDICVLCLRRTLTPVKSFSKVGGYALRLTLWNRPLIVKSYASKSQTQSWTIQNHHFTMLPNGILGEHFFGTFFQRCHLFPQNQFYKIVVPLSTKQNTKFSGKCRNSCGNLANLFLLFRNDGSPPVSVDSVATRLLFWFIDIHVVGTLFDRLSN